MALGSVLHILVLLMLLWLNVVLLTIGINYLVFFSVPFSCCLLPVVDGLLFGLCIVSVLCVCVCARVRHAELRRVSLYIFASSVHVVLTQQSAVDFGDVIDIVLLML